MPFSREGREVGMKMAVRQVDGAQLAIFCAVVDSK
jgi:hypothetical protein